MTVNDGDGAGTAVPTSDLDRLIAVARDLAATGDRRILGITGAPGAGKSTLSALLVEALGDDAVIVGMDGFHLRDDELRRQGSYQRKGAIDTFDVAGYVNLLHRLRACEPLVYVPVFDRGLEESIGSAVPVRGDVPLIIAEGNYLLADQGDWAQIAPLLDECWYVEPGDDLRLERLIRRHIAFGRSPDEAYERSTGSDGTNAKLVASTRHRATRIVVVPPIPADPAA